MPQMSAASAAVPHLRYKVVCLFLNEGGARPRAQERLDHNLSAMLTHAARAVQQVAASKLALDLVTA